MGKKIAPESIHPNTPAELIVELQAVGWKERALSRKLGVNILYISQLIKDGVEPTDKTEKGQAAREKLFLPKRKIKHKVDVPQWMKTWRRLPITERHKVIQEYLKHEDGT